MLDLIDTSVWQGRIDWGAVARSGIVGAITKASEGLGYQDPQWPSNQAGLLSVSPGFVGGSYHFLRPDLGSDPVAEADFYLSCHDHRVFDAGTPWIFALDAESSGGSAAGCQAFLERVSSRVGYDCWFYSYTSWISARGVQAFKYPLWIAAPSAGRGSPPAMGWPAVTAHQYGSRGVPGIAGQVDANDFLGDRNALLKLAGMGSSQPLPAARSYDVALIVQRQADTPDAHGLGSVYSFDFLNKVYIADGKLAEWATQFNPPPFTGKLIPMPGVFLDRYEEEAGILINQSKPAFDPASLEAKLDKVLAHLEPPKA